MQTTPSTIVHVINRKGLHARPATVLAQEAQGFPCKISLHLKDNAADAKSVLDILSLAAVCGAEVEIRASGTNAHDAVSHLAELFDRGFN